VSLSFGVGDGSGLRFWLIRVATRNQDAAAENGCGQRAETDRTKKGWAIDEH
jgi:hypothetical protein